jgi:hypothetical protein
MGSCSWAEPSDDFDMHDIQTKSEGHRLPCLSTGNSASLFHHGMCRKLKISIAGQAPVQHGRCASECAEKVSNSAYGPIWLGNVQGALEVLAWGHWDGQAALGGPVLVWASLKRARRRYLRKYKKSRMQGRPSVQLPCSFHAADTSGWLLEVQAPAWKKRRKPPLPPSRVALERILCVRP